MTQNLAVKIISKSSRERPADAVLREELKAARNVMPQDARAISETVFNYYRWRGWLDLEKPLEVQIRKARELAADFGEHPESFGDSTLVERAVPAWVREQVDVTSAWVRVIQSEPKLWLRARQGQGAQLCEKLGAAKLERDFLPDAIHYVGEEDLFKRAEFHTGEFEIQDIASQAVGWLCAPKPCETWWDACAGEGGKLLHLSDLMQNKGLIWASDRAAWRLKTLKRRAARAKVFNYRCVVWDGGQKFPTKTKCDGVLLDAPCSGIGTWQRNPHARWTVTPEDVSELGELQKGLLANAAPAVKPGGKLLYSVCTMLDAETKEVVAAFEARFPKFKPLTLRNPFNKKETSPQFWLWPQETGGNGMFVAAWERTE